MSEPVVLQENMSAEDTAISRFWISSYPFFTTTLFVLPPPVWHHPSGTRSGTALTLFDADGGVVNEVRLQFAPGEVGCLDLDPLLGACKLESGMKHGTLLLCSPAGTAHYCRLSQEDKMSVLGELVPLQCDRAIFLPVSFGEHASSLLVLANFSSGEEAKIKCRLFLGSKNPEIELSVPPNGSRVINLEVEFADFIDVAEGEKRRAYLRIVTRSDLSLGAQLVEKGGPPGAEEFRSLC